ncbi:hypothetical protein [Alkalihalobacillus sp. LMS39]|uniref:hypothetical protein n=1 Tax=Alkalihalobacillus sp. LMS39 TaxID=2924032 RepID=UPI001FB1C06F|nr:hypothetical protein [Alkalihalobacillus sp. LMS39]UOE93888.1 hypothetical protein MM271_22390 [Alkalihalobacillus sp. LMS39]
MKTFLFVAFGVLLLTGCGQGQSGGGTNPVVDDDVHPQPQTITVEEDDFKLSLFTNKAVYKEKEPVDIWAEFGFFGEEETMTIGHAMHYLGFYIEQTDGDLTFPYMMPEPYILTTLKQGEWEKTDYEKSTGFVGGDPNAAFYKKWLEEDEVTFPPGTYKVTVVAHFIIDMSENDLLTEREKTSYTMEQSLEFTVTR